jgi:hypothetical protein
MRKLGLAQLFASGRADSGVLARARGTPEGGRISMVSRGGFKPGFDGTIRKRNMDSTIR